MRKERVIDLVFAICMLVLLLLSQAIGNELFIRVSHGFVTGAFICVVLVRE